jgi:hypothetical protein
MNRILPALAFIAATSGHLAAQQAPAAPSLPKTKLEAFDATTGSVIVHGFTSIGSLNGQLGGSLAVESKEFTNAATAKKEYGITVQVKETGRLDRENTSYVDYDEIDSLLKGIDYIGKVDSSSTKFQNFQADYHTKGDLTVATFSTGARGTMVAVTSGRIGATSVYLKFTDLQAFRELIAKAKAAIDGVKTAG